MSGKLTFFITDVFGTKRYSGNQLATFLEQVCTTTEQQETSGDKVNRTKSGVLATAGAVGLALKNRCRETGLPLVTELKDLSVAQGKSTAARAIALKRWKEAVERLERVTRLPVPLQYKAHLAAGSALTAGAFAVAGRAVPQELVRTMRRWVRWSLCMGSSR